MPKLNALVGKERLIIQHSFLCVPPLYDYQHSVQHAHQTLSILSIAAITAGYSFTPLLCFACRNPYFRLNGVFIPCLSSSAFALLALALTSVFSSHTIFNRAAIAAITVAASLTVVYGVLSTILLRHTSLIQSAAYTGSDSVNPLVRNQNFGQTHSVSSDASSSRCAGSSWDPETTFAPSLHTKSSSKALQAQPPSSSKGTSFDHPVSSRQYGHPPVPSTPAKQLSPAEDDLTRNMLGLLLKKTSEQARQNPDSNTFRIELPRHMLKSLQRDDSLLTACSEPKVPEIAVHPEKTVQELPVDGATVPTTLPPSRPRYYRPPGTGPSATGAVSLQVPPADDKKGSKVKSPGGASMQETPARMYGGWKTREDRQKEIETR